MTTFSALLDAHLRRDAGRPLVTFYDDATGERVELSVATYANWVAKTSSLLVEEYDAERGQTLLVDLPTHWLGPVFLGAAWTVGLVVGFDDDTPADLVVCGPERLDRHASRAGELPVIACSLRPLGVRFAEALPDGVHDFGLEVWGQPDAFVPWDPPTADAPALSTGSGVRSQRELFEGSGEPRRLMTEANPASESGLAGFTEPFASGGSTIWVRHRESGDPGQWLRRLESEKAVEA